MSRLNNKRHCEPQAKQSAFKKTAVYALLAAAAVLLLAVPKLQLYSVHAASARYGGSSMIVIDSAANRVLYESNARVARPIASTTKILTAITVIENSDLDKQIKVPKAAVGVEGSSIYLQNGETATVRDLLYGLMLKSGNDCAAALAITVGGDIAGFAKLMNATARKAGAGASANFVNPHGLHDDAHLCSAYDLALISSYAMRSPEFRKIASAKAYNDMPYGGRDYNRIILNKNRLLHSFAGANGIKTGFTKKAGRCLVSSAERDGMEVIAVVLNCGPMFEECARLMNKAFSEYGHGQLFTAGEPIGECHTDNPDMPVVELYAHKSLRYPLTEAEAARVEVRIKPLNGNMPPIDADTPVAEYAYYLDGKELGKGLGYSREIIFAREITEIM